MSWVEESWSRARLGQRRAGAEHGPGRGGVGAGPEPMAWRRGSMEEHTIQAEGALERTA